MCALPRALVRPALELADIVGEHGAAYRRCHVLTPEQHTVLGAILRCRTAERPPANGSAAIVAPMAMFAPLVIALAPNILSVRHWDRLLGGALYAVTPRTDWARLLRRSTDVDALKCPTCDGRLRVLAIITERGPVHRILSHLGLPTGPPPVARARDPSDDVDDLEEPGQLELALV